MHTFGMICFGAIIAEGTLALFLLLRVAAKVGALG